MYNTGVILQKFADNNFWARDAATRCVVDKISTPKQLNQTVQNAFASETYQKLTDKTKKLDYAHSVSKMAGLAAMKLNLQRHGAEAIDVLNDGRRNRVIVWDPQDPDIAVLNVNGKMMTLPAQWEKAYRIDTVATSSVKKAVLV